MHLKNETSQPGRAITASLLCIAAVLAVGTGLAEDEQSSGPDIVTFRVYEPEFYGTVGGISAYAIGTESCNRGDEHASWVSGTPEHPVIAQNLYRLKDNRLEQIGMSWLKHGFLSLNQDLCNADCQSDDPTCTSSALCVGCSDPYWASLNGSQSGLGPRHEVNGFTGVFTLPHSVPVGDDTTRGRLQVKTTDVDPASNPGARYFAEGQYVTADEAAAGNSENSASYREQSIASNLQMNDVGSTFEAVPAIYAWEAADAAVTTIEVRVPREGLFIVAERTEDNGDGTWSFDYAIANLTSHRSAQSLTIPILPGAVVSNTGFHDVDYHSGEPYDSTDWTITVDSVAGTVTWATETFDTNPNANAVRWGTMYNFWFDADHAPMPGSATIGLFRPGTSMSVPFDVAASVIFLDGFESGNSAQWF